ncbi:hypothetical protein F2P44_22915 [Massilia sp. CCM 8695]|uniref:ABC transmembrane type-1 domain-containing protein n=1 Tax=Massilia frigida TaxID=2609281 RepID=A0ABX0NAJ3_9BURK|nr:hypothetical protein [Massilia frigida]NHZ82107.1 hypothetical protein [Massilia frigida]
MGSLSRLTAAAITVLIELVSLAVEPLLSSVLFTLTQLVSTRERLSGARPGANVSIGACAVASTCTAIS